MQVFYQFFAQRFCVKGLDELSYVCHPQVMIALEEI